jgi:hypothetical protein
MNGTVQADSGGLAVGRTAPGPVAIAGAVVCAGLAVLIAAATVYVTFGLSEGYGFGPAWDLSAFVMTGGAPTISAAGAVAAVSLAGLRLSRLRVLGFSAAAVFAAGYVAGAIGNSLH